MNIYKIILFTLFAANAVACIYASYNSGDDSRTSTWRMSAIFGVHCLIAILVYLA